MQPSVIMKKLIQINTGVNIGSTGRLAEDIGNVAMSSGMTSYIAYGRDHRHSQSNEIKIGNRLSVLSDVLMTRLFDRHGHGAYWATKAFLRKLDLIEPDVIHLHNIHGYYLNYPLLFKYIAERDIPVIWSLHDCWCMTGHCSHFVRINCQKWMTGCFDCPLITRYPNSWFADASRRNYNEKKKLFNAVPRLIMAPTSEWLGGLLRKSFLGDKEIHVIPDGIDTTVFSPQIEKGGEIRKRLGLEGKFVILATGTVWEDYKGIPEYRKLRKTLPSDYAIVFVGMSAKDIERHKDSCEGIIMQPRTESLAELAAYYSMADCVMSLSRMESFGLTPIEGYACGTPAIVNNATALPELITEKTGFVVNSNDIDDIKAKVLLMKKQGKDYYSQACRDLAISQYSKEFAYGKYLNLYSRFIKG